MKQIVDKLNKIAKKIDESVEIPQTDLIIDSLDAITKAYGGTPNDSNLIVDKLEDIAGVAHSGITPTGNIEITENGENINVAQYATATVNVSGGETIPLLTATVVNNSTHNVDTGGVSDYHYPILVNNVLEEYVEISANDTEQLNYLYCNWGTDGFVAPIYFTDNTDNQRIITVSDAVNCTYNALLNALVITDHTLPASATITITYPSEG